MTHGVSIASATAGRARGLRTVKPQTQRQTTSKGNSKTHNASHAGGLAENRSILAEIQTAMSCRWLSEAETETQADASSLSDPRVSIVWAEVQ